MGISRRNICPAEEQKHWCHLGKDRRSGLGLSGEELDAKDRLQATYSAINT